MKPLFFVVVADGPWSRGVAPCFDDPLVVLGLLVTMVVVVVVTVVDDNSVVVDVLVVVGCGQWSFRNASSSSSVITPEREMSALDPWNSINEGRLRGSTFCNNNSNLKWVDRSDSISYRATVRWECRFWAHRSNTGSISLQGPHHLAQASTNTILSPDSNVP